MCMTFVLLRLGMQTWAALNVYFHSQESITLKRLFFFPGSAHNPNSIHLQLFLRALPPTDVSQWDWIFFLENT